MLPETRFLVQYLRELEVGDVADFATLSEKAGFPIGKRRHILMKALEIVARDHQMVFQSVPTIGYKRIAEEIAPDSISTRCRNRIRGQTKRWRQGIINSGQASTLAGSKGLNGCLLVEVAVDADVQRVAEMNSRHVQAIDFNERKERVKRFLQSQGFD